MAAEILNIHHLTPELRKISKVADAIKNGAVILYPTDTGFTLGCALSNKEAITRLRQIRRLPDNKALTFLCDSLSNIAEFAKVSNLAYKTIKRLIPGPYTFVLPASKLVPKLAQDAKRKTSGIRVPNNDLSTLLLKDVGSPIISISAKLDTDDFDRNPERIIEAFAPMVDIAVSSDEYSFTGESTVIDMTTDEFKIMREGAGVDKAFEFIGEQD